jgi:Carboxypeptidase regulatory-like domain/CarboxypepD_reg-like domain/Repeat of unknown function (DUF5648)
MVKHFARVAVILVVVIGAMFGFAATAQAFPTKTSQCTGCHSGGGVSVAATPVSNNGTTAVYDVNVTGGTAWALFNGSTKLSYAAAATGQFSVPVGGTYTLFGVNGPTTGDGVAQITVSPVAPPTAGSMSGAVTNASSLAAISGATVSITGTTLTTTTDAAGHYTFASVSAGAGTITFAKTGFTTVSKAFTVASGANTALDAALAPPALGSISGTVTDASSTVPVSGVTVGIGGTSLTTTTDALGHYSFASVPVGGGSLVFSAAGYATLSKAYAVTLGVTAVVDAALAKQTALPVCRFYNTRTGTHFYTADPAEKADVIAHLPWYRYEGVAYTVDVGNAANNAPLYRFYNKENGTHFYTADVAEKSRIISTMSDKYSYDGPAYNVSLTKVPGATTVTRFYNKVTGTHFYTADSSETANVTNTMSAMFSLDGPAFYLAP